MDDKVLEILKKRTFNMFNEQWYIDTVNDIFNIKKEQKGYVYFVSNGLNNQIKIGKSKTINNRLNSFKTVFTSGVFLHGYIYSQDYNELELELHSKFEKFKITNEWFNLSPYILKTDLSNYNYKNVDGYYENKSSVIEGMFSRFNHKKNIETDLDFKFYDFLKLLAKNRKYYKTKIRKTLIDYDKEFEKWSAKKIHIKAKDYLEYSGSEYEFGKDHLGRYLIIIL